jgi:urea transporter
MQIAGVFASERAELAFTITSLLISGTAVVVSCLRRSAPRAVWGTFVVGAGLVVAARIGVDWAEAIEQGLVVAGAGLIVAAHLANLFVCGCRKEGSSCVTTG